MTRFFLTVCIHQVTFMETLVEPDRQRTRILPSAEEAIAVRRCGTVVGIG